MFDAGTGPDLTLTHVLLSAHKSKSLAAGLLVRKHELIGPPSHQLEAVHALVKVPWQRCSMASSDEAEVLR
jgi:hypothetical protein